MTPKHSKFADIAHFVFGNAILLAYICLVANGMRAEAVFVYGAFFVFEGLWRIRDKTTATPIAFVIAGVVEMVSGVCRLLAEESVLTATTELVDMFASVLIIVAIFEKQFLSLTESIKEFLKEFE